jgi:hypothetical protein
MNIPKNTVERIYVTALNTDGEFLSGLTDVILQIKRKSDGFFLDFSENIFKGSGWTEKTKQLEELNNMPGTYFYDFDTDGLQNDNYFIRVTSITADNSPWEGELKVGGIIDEVVTKSDLNEVKETLARILGLSKENQKIVSPIHNSKGLLTGATIKIYSSASDCNNDVNPIASYQMTSTYDSTGKMTSYKVVKI